MTEIPLFDGYEPAPVPETPKLSADRRRTIRRQQLLDAGRHPLMQDPLHREAAPVDDKDAPGRRCGNCAHILRYSFLKCDLVPITSGPGTDLRAWWPGCIHHEEKR